MSRLPDGIVNGSSTGERLEQDARIWERAWTVEEMRQSSHNWSLAADSGLFLFLQDFSQRMLSKTHDIEKQLDSLIRDTKATDSCLQSVFNDFLMLSNTQFIENRVYDEEVEETMSKADALEKQTEQEKTREQKEAELIPKMQEAVTYGLNVLDSAFERLDIKAGNSDSEDEEVTGRVEAILEPKDLYVDRPLPYLIGSKAFMEQDDVGLGDLSSDEMSVDSDRDSVVESEDRKDADHSDDDFIQEEEEGLNNITKKSSMLSYEEDGEDEEEDSDIFGESDGDEDDAKNTDPSSFADELAARIKGEPVNKPEGDRESLTSKKKNKGRKVSKPAKPQVEEDDDDDIFKPPKMDDDDIAPFGGKSGLFSGGRGLFDDDDEGDLFSEAPKAFVSEEPKVLNERLKNDAQTPESDKPGKKNPAGAISIFPDNLFNSGNDSDSVESKENRTPDAPRQVPTGAGIGGSGLFDEDEGDGFFSSLKTSDSTGQEKHKPQTIGLFDNDGEDGDLFGDKFSSSAQSQKDTVEQDVKHPEKKMPAGAISMFGPETKTLLSEGLKKRQLSTSKGSEKSEENGSAPDAGKTAVEQTRIPQTRGLFSDDEDALGFPTIPKSQSKPESTSQGKPSKAPVSLFDDEEEEDLFVSAAKSRPKRNQVKASTPQPSKTFSSSLFSDDEDQWMSFTSGAGRPEVKTPGMKPSASAPSSLPSAKTSQRSVFDNDDDDLFAPTKESSQKMPHRVSLLFEDEDDGEKGILFGVKPAVNTDTPAPPAQRPASATQSSILLEKSAEVSVLGITGRDAPSELEKPAAKGPEDPQPRPSPPAAESSKRKKKPPGAVSLFGGIDVLATTQTKSILDEDGDDESFLSKDNPPLDVKREEKAKANAVSLFDQEEGAWNEPIFTPSKPTARKALKSAEEQAKSTRVFQDEELLFSQTQQKDNDPDVDLFATSGKAASSKLGSVKPAAQSLFADDDYDDLFGSVKPQVPPPKVTEKPNNAKSKAPVASPESASEIQKPSSSPVKPKDSSSRIGKLHADLMINPAALLPGAVPSLPGAVGVLPRTAPSSSSGVSSLSPSPATTPMGAPAGHAGVSFDTPVRVTTLQSTQKTRAKVPAQRRPQSRAARQQAAQRALMDEDTLGGDGARPDASLPGFISPLPDKPHLADASPTIPDSSASTALPVSTPPQSSSSGMTPRPSVLTLAQSTNPGKKDSRKDSSNSAVLPSYDKDDLFGSDALFGDATLKNTPSPPRQTINTKQPQASSDLGAVKDKSLSPSIFDDHTDYLFKKVKPRASTKQSKNSQFLEEDDDDDGVDLFGVSNSPTPSSTSSKEFKNGSSFSKQDIFQDEVATAPKVNQKHKEKPLDSMLFDDNIDIFADLTDTFKPKQTSKTKGQTKSIFDDDMDDIFSSTVKPVTKTPLKPVKIPPSQEALSNAETSNIFDDPLNALGGN
ncbi:WASH complex subunit 2 [Brachionichthys hirsutus]|uniref:WASH complex subunit 2 n=1 Tax=Brachionichthys hirsutus TaxID=412623 RepID=UPI0036043307